MNAAPDRAPLSPAQATTGEPAEAPSELARRILLLERQLTAAMLVEWRLIAAGRGPGGTYGREKKGSVAERCRVVEQRHGQVRL